LIFQHTHRRRNRHATARACSRAWQPDPDRSRRHHGLGGTRDYDRLYVNTIGYILLVVGILGALLSLVFWSSWAGPGYFADGGPRRRRTVIEE
jgi:hypothetical protein